MDELKAIDHVWDVLENKKIILYGASGGGKKMLSFLRDAGIFVTVFCDSDISKAGTLFCGIPVISRDDLKQYNGNEEYCIIISSCYLVEIYKDLMENIKWEGDCFSSFAISWGLWFSMQEEKDVPLCAANYWKRKKVFLEAKKLCYNTISSARLGGLSDWTLDSLLFTEDPYLVFQPSKTGSFSICDELWKHGKNAIHIHDIGVFFKENKARKKQKKELLQAIKNTRNLKIVTGVRDPVARDISLVFQMLQDGACYLDGNEKCNFLLKVRDTVRRNAMLKKGSLSANHGWSEHVKNKVKYGVVFDWFDWEIKRFFGIDIFQYDFDKDKGFSVIKENNVKIFVYKLEKMDEPDLKKALREFLEIDDFDIQHTNDGGKKNYSLCYQEVLEKIKLGGDYIDFYYKDNPRMKYFYTDEEIEAFRRKWEKNK